MVSDVVPASDFIGRQDELAILTSALDDAISGQGRIVMLAGEPGIGKTRIAHELVAQAEAKGAKVLWGWCYERQGAPPYWPWIQAIRSHSEKTDAELLRQELGAGLSEIAGILPELAIGTEQPEPPATSDPEQARFRLFVAISDFLTNIGASQPLAIVLDDLQWADESSLLLLEFIARNLTTNPIIVIGTYRDVEVGSRHPLAGTLGGLIREEVFQRINMTGLDRGEVGEFITSKSGIAAPDAAVDALHQRTEGNPLFVGEVVGSLSPEQLAEHNVWLDNIPDAVREVIIRRLSRLSDHCEQVVRNASVIGRDFDLPLLESLCGDLSETEFLDAFDEAVAARVIDSSPIIAQQFRFGHALIQQAIYEEFSPMRKMRIHATIADALEHRYQIGVEGHAAELAHHFAEAGTPDAREKAIDYSLIAGEYALSTFAYEQAFDHFTLALAFKEGQTVDDQTAQAIFGLGRAQTTVLPRHRLGEAHQNLLRAFDYYVETNNTAQIVAIGQFPIIALSEHAISTGLLAGRALELVPPDSLDAARLHGLYGRSQGMENGDNKTAQESFDKALAIAKREADISLEMSILLHATQVDSWHHDFQLAAERSQRAVDIALELSDLRGEVAARYFLSIATRTLGDIEGYKTQATNILEPAEKLHDRYWLAPAYSTAAMAFYFDGDSQSAKSLNDLGLAQMPMDPRVMLHRLFIEAVFGNREETEKFLERMEQIVANSEALANTANASLAFAAGVASNIFGSIERPDPANGAISAVLTSEFATPFFALWAKLGAALIAVANNDVAAAQEYYEEIKPSAGYLVVATSVDRVLGLLSRTFRELDQAVDHFEDASAFLRSGQIKPELAWNCYDYASALVQRNASGDRQQAGRLLGEASSMAAEMGITPLQEKVESLQANMGSRQTRSLDNPGGLTQREIEVLKLISGGMTDREIGEELFISIKTVGNHVSNILNKTDSANRTEAATFAARNDIVPEDEST